MSSDEEVLIMDLLLCGALNAGNFFGNDESLANNNHPSTPQQPIHSLRTSNWIDEGDDGL